jgi:RNA polymerase sigma-70 factor (ECF subfamily)
MERFAEQLVQARAALMRSAQARLRNRDWAADAVSETLLAALEARPRFDDADRLRAWLHGVLRHKVVDQFRRHLGEAPSPDQEPEATDDDPERRLVLRQGMVALEQALCGLPARQARAFWLREALGETTDEVCAALGVSAGHAFVLLHRARRELQRRLQPHRP